MKKLYDDKGCQQGKSPGICIRFGARAEHRSQPQRETASAMATALSLRGSFFGLCVLPPNALETRANGVAQVQPSAYGQDLCTKLLLLGPSLWERTFLVEIRDLVFPIGRSGIPNIKDGITPKEFFVGALTWSGGNSIA